MFASWASPVVAAVASVVMIALPAAAAHAGTEPAPVASSPAASPSSPAPVASSPSPVPSSLPTPTAPASSAPLEMAANGLAGTNLTAVVDPRAVKVADGYRIRVGVRNSGPRSVTASVGHEAVLMQVYVVSGNWLRRTRSLGNCRLVSETPPYGDPPVIDVPVSYFDCRFRGTLRVGQTYWESFIFPELPSSRGAVWIVAEGADTNSSDNWRYVVVRLARTDDRGGGLPVTGNRPLVAAGIAIALLLAGALMLWSGRRRAPSTAGPPRRRLRPTPSQPRGGSR